MTRFRALPLTILILGLALPAAAQFGPKKIRLKRALPPAISLEAKSFNITASSQERAGDQIAASFAELFKAKIQGDERFIYDDVNPALRVSIVVTRFYVEPKSMIKGKAPCTTNLGNLQGTFRVLESDTGRPVASDALGWKLQTTATQHVLVSEDGRQANISGPQEKMNPVAFWSSDGNSESLSSKLFSGLGGGKHPCDIPFTPNEARDALADAFLTDIIHLATPYTISIEVPVSKDKLFKTAVEEIEADRWSRALDELLLVEEQPKPEDEASRLYLIGLTYEGLGYRQGEQAFEVSKKIAARLPADELARQQAELARIVDLAKENFDQASLYFSKANDLKDEQDYRNGERRADQSRSLYARIQKYRDMQAQPPEEPKVSKLSMAEIVGMCAQGLADIIIVDRIESAPDIGATRQQVVELAKCGEKQGAIFSALKKRWDAAPQE